MLASLYSAEGVVFAADSQVTEPGTTWKALPAQQKVFRVRGVGTGDGLVGFFGLAQVRGEPMTQWLRSQFRAWRGGSAQSLADFLAEVLRRDLSPHESGVVSGFHIGAFEKREGIAVPVFVFLRNTHSFQDGVHGSIGDFHQDEQFLGHYARGIPLSKLRAAIRDHQRSEGLPFWLRNGDLTFFAPVWDGIQSAAKTIVSSPDYRTPTTLVEWERFARTLIVTTSQLYRVLWSGGAPLIGNRPRVASLPWP
jgi:hypothetical protein